MGNFLNPLNYFIHRGGTSFYSNLLSLFQRIYRSLLPIWESKDFRDGPIHTVWWLAYYTCFVLMGLISFVLMPDEMGFLGIRACFCREQGAKLWAAKRLDLTWHTLAIYEDINWMSCLPANISSDLHGQWTRDGESQPFLAPPKPTTTLTTMQECVWISACFNFESRVLGFYSCVIALEKCAEINLDGFVFSPKNHWVALALDTLSLFLMSLYVKEAVIL